MHLQVHGKVLPSLLMRYGHLVDIFKAFQRLFHVQGNGQMRLIGWAGGVLWFLFLWDFVILGYFLACFGSFGRRRSISLVFQLNFTAISTPSVKHGKVLTVFTSDLFFISCSLQFKYISALFFHFVWLLLLQSVKWVEEMHRKQSCLCNSFCYLTKVIVISSNMITLIVVTYTNNFYNRRTFL